MPRADSVADPRHPNVGDAKARRRIRIKGSQSRVNVVRGPGVHGQQTGPLQGAPTQLTPIKNGHHRVWAVNAVRRVGTGWWERGVLGGRGGRGR